MPTDHGVRLDNDEDIAPARPEPTECRPEESIQGVQHWARTFAFQDGDLLSQGKDFKSRIAPAPEEDADDREHGQDEFTHELNLVTLLSAALPRMSTH